MTQHNDGQDAVSFGETKEQAKGNAAPPSGSSGETTKDDTPKDDEVENEKALKRMEEADAAAQSAPVSFAESGDAVWAGDDKELVGDGKGGVVGTNTDNTEVDPSPEELITADRDAVIIVVPPAPTIVVPVLVPVPLVPVPVPVVPGTVIPQNNDEDPGEPTDPATGGGGSATVVIVDNNGENNDGGGGGGGGGISVNVGGIGGGGGNSGGGGHTGEEGGHIGGGGGGGTGGGGGGTGGTTNNDSNEGTKTEDPANDDDPDSVAVPDLTAPVLRATPKDGKVILKWTIACNPSLIQHFLVYESNAANVWDDYDEISTQASTVKSIKQLTNGNQYYFGVELIATDGRIFKSNICGPVTPCTVSSAPSNVKATTGNTSVALAWTVPTNNGGSAITGYEIQQDENANDLRSCTENEIIIEELTNGTKYSFKVRAVNSAGKSKWSNVVGPVAPCTVPSTPMSVGATSGNSKVNLTWDVPENNGGSAITGYEIQQDENENELRSCTENELNIEELTNGNEYSFKVRAVNDAGKSEWSNVVSHATPCTTPSVPTNVEAAPGDSKVNLTWDVPENNGSSAITGYEIQQDENANELRSCTENKLDIKELINGTKYSFKVRAVNSAGCSEWSNVVGPVAPCTAPSTPNNVEAAPGDSNIQLSWNLPGNNGGSVITGYEIQQSKSGGEQKTSSESNNVRIIYTLTFI